MYSAYDVTQKVGVMSYKSGCDIIGEVVMTKIQWVRCLIQGVWCHAWSGCDIINTMVWCDRVDVMSSAVQRMSYICQVWSHQHSVCDVILSGYYVINIVDMMSQIYWSDIIHRVAVISSMVSVWWHRYSGCEVRYSGLDAIHKVVWCPKEWLWCHM